MNFLQYSNINSTENEVKSGTQLISNQLSATFSLCLERNQINVSLQCVSLQAWDGAKSSHEGENIRFKTA